MRIAFMGAGHSIHTQRWVTGLSELGVEVLLITQDELGDWKVPNGVRLEMLPFRGNKGYFLNAPSARRALNAYAPDLVNCHYASGYGTLANLCRYRPTLLSVWGSDVYDFPYQSILAGFIVRYNLRVADRIASTSHVMAKQVQHLVPEIGEVDITPFGVECDRFTPMPENRDHIAITIGTVKTLSHKYGIDTLIDAFAILINDQDKLADNVRDRLHLLLVGGGPDQAELQARADALKLEGRVTFAGKVSHADVPKWLNRLDIYVAASRLDSESFGVAVIEASSCELPVVVSNVGGLPEVVEDGLTGLVIPRNDSVALSAALARLVADAPLRISMGRAGRSLVQRNYEWKQSLEQMIKCYTSLCSDKYDC